MYLFILRYIAISFAFPQFTSLIQRPEWIKCVQKQSKINRPKRLVQEVNCVKIIEGDVTEIQKAEKITQKDLGFIPDETYVNFTKDCDTFKYLRGYILEEMVLKTEKAFPIAFSILLYKDVEQAERTLRALYRPHNIYCLHVDLSADPVIHKAVRALVKCFDNVFVSSKLEDVIYAGMTRVKADLNCMADLLKSDVQWKYFINTPSQQFPLQTNLEFVKILTLYNGSNDIEGITQPTRMMISRITNKYVIENGTMVRTDEKMGKPPHNITIVKGSAYGVFSRKFVDFILHNKVSKDLLAYLSDVNSPDEYYWSTLNHDRNIGAPGGYTGVPDEKPFLATYANWGGPCHGKYVRGMCIYGLGDLTELVSRKELFANKFHYDYQPLALSCLEEWHVNKTFVDLPFKSYYYRQLPFRG
ncbi:beta-1,3-galactosyl-O-glycosyl-glycoprotein beta-1,6-N-acetylglucosaminyltransferase 4-like [Ylistrum balloti]|uniref:beta-1,3-galactosyl-O-glycosyl-glycoprotein beta-1,6-N-acetylglucosaminyltransferase 4-like n=1 Tax=Ylistrum balloti TaxID=509963 RepID=UPI0029058AC8|nr:beta-1,3-galactosyl-O-glycosyl-glycoprotein beta-1,6-N-acetylglucosaminyltransferase 4-like [Ylistrum balloti]